MRHQGNVSSVPKVRVGITRYVPSAMLGPALLLRFATMTSYPTKGSSPSIKNKKKVACPTQPFSANEFHHEPHLRLKDCQVTGGWRFLWLGRGGCSRGEKKAGERGLGSESGVERMKKYGKQRMVLEDAQRLRR